MCGGMRGIKHIYTHSKLQNVSLIGCISVTCGFKPSYPGHSEITRLLLGRCRKQPTKPLYQAFSHCEERTTDSSFCTSWLVHYNSNINHTHYLSCRPFSHRRGFTAVTSPAVCIPPTDNVSTALSHLHYTVSRQYQTHPVGVHILIKLA